MGKFRTLALIELLVIIILVAVLIYMFFYHLNTSNSPQGYCKTHTSDPARCMLSPRIYNDILSPNSFLIINFEPLKTQIQSYLANYTGVSVYIENLRDGASFGINSTKQYPAASLNKLPIAIIILKKVEKGKLSLDTNLTISSADKDSSSGTLYLKNINSLSVRDLIYYMLAESDNTAAWVLQRQMAKEDLVSLTNYMDYYSNNIESESTPLNVTEVTPRTVSNVFISLYLSTALEPEHSELILKDLVNSSFDVKSYANLPSDVIVAQKYGYNYRDEAVLHSCGILYIQDSRFSYCVMTQNLDDTKAQEIIGTIVNKLYNFVVESKKIKDLGF